MDHRRAVSTPSERPLAGRVPPARVPSGRSRAMRAASRAAQYAVPPSRSAELDHLDIDGLRTLRNALVEEEDRVSYWRRILQARLDTSRAGTALAAADPKALAPVLTQARVGAGRSALVRVLPVDDIPPLPDLARLWESCIDAGDDPEALDQLTKDLVAAEAELSTYRRAMHERINQATEELVARYREQPSLCLRALPLELAG